MWRRYLLSALIVAIPTVLLVTRVLTDELDAYGWGWQMFS